MFHVMLILSVLIFGIAFLAFIAGAMLFAILAIIVAVIGTTSVAMLVKDKLVRKLLFSGFANIFLFGAACLLPVLMAFAHIGSSVAFACVLVIAALSALSAAFGIKNARNLNSKGAKTAVIVLFAIVLTVAISVLGSILFYIAFIAV